MKSVLFLLFVLILVAISRADMNIGMKVKRNYALGYGYGGYGGYAGYGHAPVVAAHAPVVAAHAPVVAAHAPVVAAHAPVVHHAVAAAPLAYHAPVAKYAATSYVASSINHTPFLAAAHTPLITHAAPVVAHAAPVVAHAAPVVAHAAPVVAHTSIYHDDPYLPALHNPLPYYYHRR